MNETNTFDNNNLDNDYIDFTNDTKNEPIEDETNRPLTITEYLKMLLWLLVPIVNIIFQIKWAIGGDNINLNKRNFWRAYWIYFGIIFTFVLLICILVFSVIGVIGGAL